MSFLDRLKHITPFSPRTLHVVEIDTSEVNYRARFVRMVKSYGKVSVKQKEADWRDLEDVLELIQRRPNIPFFNNYPVIICLVGNKVISRKIDAAENQDKNIILQKVLPGARPDDFIMDTFPFAENNFVSVIKSNVVSELINSFGKSKLDVIGIGLGPPRTLVFCDSFPSTKRSFVAGKYKYNLDELVIAPTNEREDNIELNIEGIVVQTSTVLTICTGLSYFSNALNNETQTAEVDKISKEVQFSIYQNALLRSFFLAVVFLISTSYFLNQNYQEALIELQDATAEQNNSYKLFQIKQAEFNVRLGLLNATGVMTSLKLYKICDRIGLLTPESIQLLTMEIFPLTKKMKKDKMVEFDKSQMRVQGISPSSSVLNEWVEQLNNEGWVNEVYINNYSTTDKQLPGKFELIINV